MRAFRLNGSRVLEIDPRSDAVRGLRIPGQVTADIAVNAGWRDAVGRGSGEAIQLRLSGPAARTSRRPNRRSGLTHLQGVIQARLAQEQGRRPMNELARESSRQRLRAETSHDGPAERSEVER